MQSKRILDLTEELLQEARKKLSRPVEDRYAPISVKDFSQGSVFVCPLCHYETKKHPKGSAIIRGRVFKCFSCGETRGVIE